MKKSLERWFGQGIFFTGWKNAIFSIILAVGVYFTSQIYYVLNHGPAVINLHTALDFSDPRVTDFRHPICFAAAIYLRHPDPVPVVQEQVFPIGLLGNDHSLVHQLRVLLFPAERGDPPGVDRHGHVLENGDERIRRGQCLQ